MVHNSRCLTKEARISTGKKCCLYIVSEPLPMLSAVKLSPKEEPRPTAQGTITTFRRFEWPGDSSCVPCTATTWSPALTMPTDCACFRAFVMTESVPTNEAVNSGTIPRMTPNWRTVVWLAVIARIGVFGRYFAICLAVSPVSVRATIKTQSESTVDFTAEEHTASTEDTLLFGAKLRTLIRV